MTSYVDTLYHTHSIHRGGGGRIRTFEGIRRQIYSLIPLATRAPLHN